MGAGGVFPFFFFDFLIFSSDRIDEWFYSHSHSDCSTSKNLQACRVEIHGKGKGGGGGVVKVVEEVFPRLAILCWLLLGRVGVGCTRVVGGSGDCTTTIPSLPRMDGRKGWEGGVFNY